jgi:hypothetical protein
MNRIRFENGRQILQGIQSLMGTLKNDEAYSSKILVSLHQDYKVSDIKRWYSS